MFSDVFSQFYDSSVLWDLLRQKSVPLSGFRLCLLIGMCHCAGQGFEISRP